MEQTAVNYLIKELFTKHEENFDFNPIFVKALEMEKEQIVQAITKTIIGSNVIYDSEYPEVIHTAEQYYNETFKHE